MSENKCTILNQIPHLKIIILKKNIISFFLEITTFTIEGVVLFMESLFLKEVFEVILPSETNSLKTRFRLSCHLLSLTLNTRKCQTLFIPLEMRCKTLIETLKNKPSLNFILIRYLENKKMCK